MSFDKIFDLTAGVYFNFYNIANKQTQIANMSNDPKIVEVTADVLEILV